MLATSTMTTIQYTKAATEMAKNTSGTQRNGIGNIIAGTYPASAQLRASAWALLTRTAQPFTGSRPRLNARVRATAAAATVSAAIGGNGQTALTLISHRTYVSSPEGVFGPCRKSASQMTGSESRSMLRMLIILGTPRST